MKTLDIRHQIELVPDTDRIAPERLREHEADFTPRSVVRQGLRAIETHLGMSPDRMLDPSAGAGVFGMEAHSLWPDCYVVGIEPRDEESEHLSRNYNEYAIATFDAKCVRGPLLRDVEPFDLVGTNPPFSLLPEFLPLALAVTRACGIVAFLGLNECGIRGEVGRDLWKRYPPCMQFRIAGTIKFRNGVNPETGKPYTADMRSYSWWLWRADGRGGSIGGSHCGWVTRDMPILSPAARQWKLRPGTEGAL